MRSYGEANIASLEETCLTSDAKHLRQQLEQHLESFDHDFGLDFCMDEKRRTLLHLLAEKTEFQNWDILLEGFVYVNQLDVNQQTPLHIAVASHNIPAIQSLIANGASPTIEDDHGTTVIQYVCQTNYCEGFNELLKSYSAWKYCESNFLMLGKLCIDVVNGQSINVFSLLIKSFPDAINDADEDGFTLLHCTAMHCGSSSSKGESIAFLQKILESEKIDVNSHTKEGKTALDLTTSQDAAILLYAKGLNINRKNPPEILANALSSDKWQTTGKCYTQSELHKAVKDENVQLVQNLAAIRVDVVDPFNITPLMIAIMNLPKEEKAENDPSLPSNIMKIFKILLEKGANPNFPNKDGVTNAYELAAKLGKSEAYIYMVSKSTAQSHCPDLKHIDSDGNTLLLDAIISGESAIIIEIVRQRIDNIKLDQNPEPYIKALLSMNDNTAETVAKQLFQRGVPFTTTRKDGSHVSFFLRSAIEKGSVQFAGLLINNGYYSDDDLDECLTLAVQRDQPDIVLQLKELFDKKDKVHNGVPLLHLTAKHQTDSTMRVLLKTMNSTHEEVGSFSSDSLSAYQSFPVAPAVGVNASSNQSYHHGYHVKDAKGSNFLHYAAEACNLRCIKTAVEEFKIDANCTNSYGDSPLHFLMHERVPANALKECFEYLVKEKSADVAAVNQKGQNMLHVAAEHNNEKAIEVLLGLSAEGSEPLIDENMLNVVDSSGYTPLEIASKQRFVSASATSLNTANDKNESKTNSNNNNTNSNSNNGTNSNGNNSIDNNSNSINSNIENNGNNIISINNESENSIDVNGTYNVVDMRTAHLLNKKWQLPIFSPGITYDKIVAHINRGLSPDVIDINSTPLIIFVMKELADDASLAESVSFLLENGANPSLPDKDNLTPLHHAIRLNNQSVGSLLIDAGAQFIVDPILRVFADEENKPEMIELIKLPEKRASAVHEVLVTQENVVQTLNAVLTFKRRFDDMKLTMCLYMDEVHKMLRLLSMFVKCLNRLFSHMKPTSEFGNFFLYFVDAFMPLLNIPTTYHTATAEIKVNPTLSPILMEQIGYNNYSLADALIVPVQQLTRYHELIRAIIKATPEAHNDNLPLQRAHMKYSNIGRASNERMLIAESREKLKTIKLNTSLNSKNIQYFPNDVLLYHGQFEKKSLIIDDSNKDQESAQLSNNEWGLKISPIKCGNLTVQHFTTFGKSMKSFLKSTKIGIFLFQKIVLFGLQKKEDSFKLKFSCKSSEVMWDFSRDFGSDSFQIWTPIGPMVLKVDTGKGQQSERDFEKSQWKQNVEKLGKVDESDEITVGGREICYVSWVSDETKCVQSKTFLIACASRKEARQKIIEKMKALNVHIVEKTNMMSERVPLISFDFQTYRPAQGQASDVFSDIEL